MARLTIRFAGASSNVMYPIVETEQERLAKEFRLFVAGNQGLGIPVGRGAFACDLDGEKFQVMLNYAAIAAIHIDSPASF